MAGIAVLLFCGGSFLWVAAAHVTRRLAAGGQRPAPLWETLRDALADWAGLLAALADVRLTPRPARRTPASARKGTAILLPDAGLPGHSLRPLAAALARDGWDPVICRHRLALLGRERALRRVRDLLRRTATGRRIVLLGHGAGGLVAREATLACGLGEATRLVTIGTPHRGTRAWPYRTLCRDDLSPEGAWIRELAARRAGDETVAICTDRDPYLQPLEAADLPGAFNIEVSGLGHFTPLRSALVLQLVRENLAAARTGLAEPGSCPPLRRRL